MNDKDVRDICALLLDHPLGETDAETVNLPRLSGICAGDWGLWKTVTLSLDRVRTVLNAFALAPRDQATLLNRLDLVRRSIDAGPKPLKRTLRARIGDKMQWYDLPEEVNRG